jgi:cobalt-zinc-cadmium efflux system protein
MVHAHHEHTHEHHGHERAFAVGIALNLAFVALESVFGVLSHSMALLADASHNLSDVLALALAWGASILGRREPSQRFTYGLGSSTILAALVNAMLLMLVVGGIAVEAVQRLMNPAPVATATVIWVALCGIAVNGVTALFFLRGREHDLNVQGAFLHMAADAAVSLGVVLAGVAMLYTGWTWLDPLMSLVIAAVIVGSTWGLLRDSVNLSLHAVPTRIDTGLIRGYFCALHGVVEIHDLHIWGMSTTETALTVHLVMPDGHPGDRFIAQICRELRERFSVGHATIQVETGDALHPCSLAPDHVVRTRIRPAPHEFARAAHSRRNSARV